MLSLQVNGENHQARADHTLQELIDETNPQGGPVAVAINGEFVPRTDYDTVQLQHGDAIDIVSPVGGG